MHILVLPSWYANSLQPTSGTFFRHHAYSLMELGHTVGIANYESRVLRSLSPKALGENHFQVVDNFEHGIQTVRLKGWNPLSRTTTGAKILGRMYERAARAYIHRHGKPDVIHVQSGMWSGLAAPRLLDEFRTPFVLTEHSNFVPAVSESQARNGLYRAITQRAAAVTAVSTVLVDEIRDKSGLSEVLLTPNCIDLEFWLDEKSTETQSAQRFITVAHLISLKGIDVLVHAFKLVRETLPDASLAIVGVGVERSNLERIVSTQSLTEDVAFLGEIGHEQLRTEYSKSACYVCSSRVETFGVAPLEALAAGLPVVSTKCGGPEDFVSAPSGVLVPVDNPEAMAQAMVYQIRGDRQSQRSHGFQTASRYSHREVGLLLEGIFKKAISQA